MIYLIESAGINSNNDKFMYSISYNREVLLIDIDSLDNIFYHSINSIKSLKKNNLWKV